VVVSHAHADHTAPHREVILSAPTARFLQARLGGGRLEHVLAFGETREFDGPEGTFRLRLLPAGHVLGSALTWVEAGGESLLYTGDFKLRPGRAAERCTPCAADMLVMETTFGRPEFCFPPEEEVVAGVIRFCRETLAEGRTAVLLGYSLGKSQEILARLAGAGLPLVLHEQGYRLTEIYAEFGVTLPAFERLGAGNGRGRVVICPPAASRTALEQQLGPLRCAVLTGWALHPRCRFQYGADAAFPLSDHADFPDLLRLVEMVNPRRVLTLHGFAAEFAAALRERGREAWALSESDQLTLALGDPMRARSVLRTPA
jgi:Cft2 family RNA processing exonuclease